MFFSLVKFPPTLIHIDSSAIDGNVEFVHSVQILYSGVRRHKCPTK